MTIAYIGSYADGPAQGQGGIDVVEVLGDGARFRPIQHVPSPQQAGYLVVCNELSTLYAVNERKTGGRGPEAEPAAVHALKIADDGRLAHVGSVRTPGPFPTYLDIAPDSRLLVSANHGSFEHVERVLTSADGWRTEYVYDDSTVVAYRVSGDGEIDSISDVVLYRQGGPDPNDSQQAGGHGQASGHAHCAVFSPDHRHVVVCDKASDSITVFAAGEKLHLVHRLELPPQTGPRHLSFTADPGLAVATCEFSSTLMTFSFEQETGRLEVLDQVPTTSPDHSYMNEPADVRVHPAGWVYVNNRGEDTIAWFRLESQGRLHREGSVPLAASPHPGLAARSLALSPDGRTMLVADRPANLVRSYRVDEVDGSVAEIATMPVPDPAFVCFGEEAV